ncbi:MAG: glycoside hydrolase family 2 protein [Chitinivibrionales bacterium]|nr:glycoside hydrolase family 2 protein [Chitinivibrionales bacterium]
MQVLSLNGTWSVTQKRTRERIPATVPGTIHTDLLAAGKVDDPFYRDNEAKTLWVAEKDWVYSRQFRVPADLLNHERVLLRCDGLDTFATAKINGTVLGRTDNQFRRWEFDVKDILKTGANTIEITFESVWPYIRKKEAKRHLRTPKCIAHEEYGRPWVRKSQCNFGWDWGPVLVTCGIWKDIVLEAFDTARIGHVGFAQQHAGRKVALETVIELDRTGRQAVSAAVDITIDGTRVAGETVAIKGARGVSRLAIRNPRLWWPSGMGEQPLYTVTVTLTDNADNVLDTVTRRVGLRTLRLSRKKDRWGESFEFVVNDVPFFAKGANWIPSDQFVPRVTEQQYRHLLHSAADANMNMLRIWGGGIYENDIFYDICDELGMCVWHDFMFACSAYPGDDKAFVENVRVEAEQQVQRIGHHACMALWCGNNELEQGAAGPGTWPSMNWKYYKPIFDKLLAQAVRKHAPQTDYWPSSPHSPYGKRENHSNPECGDAHLWAVWHGRQPFEWYRTAYHRFCSEFGFQSFPEPATVAAYTVEADRNVTSPIMEFHQRGAHGNPNIMQYMLHWFRMPVGMDNTIWLSQIQQGLSVKYAVEHWRRNMDRCRGALYWQINDCWPVASWASIDYFGRWKALHYMAKKFFAPVLVSGVEDADKHTVEMYVSCDAKASVNGELRWMLIDVNGKTIRKGTKSVRVSGDTSRKVATVSFAAEARTLDLRNTMLWLELHDANGTLVSDNFVTFKTYKHIDLQDPQVAVTVKQRRGGSFAVSLKAKRPALCVFARLEGADAVFSDNFVHVRPGRTTTLTVTPSKKLSLAQCRAKLQVRSLVDTY